MTESTKLPDGSGFVCASLPHPKDHWLLCDNTDLPPFRMGKYHPCRKGFEQALRDAGKYAIRRATMNGKEKDFDPDALLQNLIIGFLGYHTEDGLSSDEFLNPKNEYPGGNMIKLPDDDCANPIQKDHWILRDSDSFDLPPMPFRMGKYHPCRKGFEQALREAGKYACRRTTMNGKEMNFDPDAFIQNLIIGFLGYHTEDGLSSDKALNPKKQSYRQKMVEYFNGIVRTWI